ncbi:hypothetical protein OG777_23285 [Micromonospora peucetia]|uniref:DUF5709 domain-containing protein n=1 Tax=Micromonospora peucetia TaxID=47871 RepID=A0ABZ1E8L6_9ACTN|nr:hypothetical protein [Micromonospora peucetia]MCX4389835.1 hypothetical protein [Micromonospora peucetia]WSA30301.1 hypothetical protein OIE14_19050 [Micromonospora peucetia]
MTDRDRDRPLEESPEVAAAVEDDIGIPQLMTGGGADRDTPSFAGPGDRPGGDARGDELIGEPYASGAAPQHIRTGAEQPWEPEDLVAARGQDPTPENVERARRDLAELGRAAIEKTVP